MIDEAYRVLCTGNVYQEEAMRTANGMCGDLLEIGVKYG